MLNQTLVTLPNDLRVGVYFISDGSVVLAPHPSMVVTYETLVDGVSSFMDSKGLVLWEEGSKEYEYDFNTAYLVNFEPLLRGWLRQQLAQ